MLRTCKPSNRRHLGPTLSLLLLLAASFLFLAGCARGDSTVLSDRTPSVVTHATHPERLTDGVIAPPGGSWNSSLTAVLETSGGVEWDLGEPRTLAAAWLQADNNDTYALLVSLDHQSWSTIWEAPPVGPGGLRARSTRALDTRARYVRLEPRGGDGNYSLSEVVLYRTASAAFPGGSAGAEHEPSHDERPAEQLSLWLAGLIAAIAIVLAIAEPLRRRLRPLPFGAALVPLGALSLLVILTALAYRNAYRGHTIDDAYISFQYAKNWASGRGLVFNPGERVEGYSNFLWIAVLTPLWPLVGHDADRFACAAFVLCLVIAVANLALLTAIARALFAHPLAWVLPALLLAFDDAYAAYAVFALENQLLLLVMLGGLWISTRRIRRWEFALGVALALAAMTRPDGILWGGAWVAAEGTAVLAARGQDRTARALALLRCSATFAALFSGYFLARYWYYGEPFPNTFYLKVGSTFAALPRGRDYLLSYLSERWWVPLLGLGGVVASRQTWARWLFAHGLLHAGYVVYVGGDFYSGHRFLMAITPSWALLAAAGLDAALARWQTRTLELPCAAAALGACLLVRAGTLRDGPGRAEIGVWNDVVDRDVRYMQWLKTRARPDASIALGDIGGAGFFADLRVVDVYGVVDRALAHKKIEGFGTGKPGHEKVASTEAVLARRPTYIKLGFVPIGRLPRGYFAFNAFPPGLDLGALLVRDDLAGGHELAGSALHFDGDELREWQREGDAFASCPSARAPRAQGHVSFTAGGFVDSFTEADGDAARGRLLSPPFVLEGDWLRLSVGGGRDPLHLTVSLLIDGRRVFSETGTNSELMGRREWDIRPLRGRAAQLEIADDATGAWGHLLVDEVSQWVGEPSVGERL
jgi:arabinofuranosyltransferase